MTSNALPSDVQVVTTETLVPLKLVDQKSPQLSDHLDAQGFDVTGVGNIEAKTVNGVDVTQALQVQDAKIEALKADASVADHTHDVADIPTLDEAIARVANAEIDKRSFAACDHTHDLATLTGFLSLKQVAEGITIADFISKDYALFNHTHVDLKQEIETLKASLGTITDSIESYTKTGDLKMAIFNLVKDVNAIKETLATVQANMPTPVSDTTELVAVGYCLVPRKVNGKKLSEISSFDMNGNPVQVTVAKKGAAVSVGDMVATDDLLTFSPQNSIVRLLFT